MLDAVGAAASLTTLITLAGDLIDLLVSLRSYISKCAGLLDSMRTLRSVLTHVENEYKKTTALIAELNGHSSSMTITNDMLESCIYNLKTTCTDLQVTLRNIAKSSVPGFKWKLKQEEIRYFGTKLEADKSTLLLLLASIR